MAIKFTTTKQEAALNGVKLLVYGQPGVGKTRLIATAPDPLVISAEAGLLSLRDKEIPAILVSTIQDVREAFAFVTSKKADKFKTICLDSISEIAETVLSSAKKRVNDKRQAYGVLLEEMIDLIKSFRDLPKKNVYFSAKELKVIDSTSGAASYEIAMPGSKLVPALPYYFDEVLHLEVGRDRDGNDTRFLRTQPNIFHNAKDRSGALDPIEKPDLSAVFRKIMKG